MSRVAVRARRVPASPDSPPSTSGDPSRPCTDPVPPVSARSRPARRSCSRSSPFLVRLPRPGRPGAPPTSRRAAPPTWGMGVAAQADCFADRGGAWSPDRTLPGVLDIEWTPYGDACHGTSRSAMVSWIRDVLDRYRARTGRGAVICTATSRWRQCTGNHAGFGTTHPLRVARYAATAGELPAGRASCTRWQYTSTGPVVGDHDLFNGTVDQVRAPAPG
ncbi:GH25 family lysozyme [Streptomyces hirsutus]|uniref:GH25 family lysozyme n=1 Tax=Streptomyces hirsutus TaxID=35620 RepID=UPI003D9F42B0